MPIIILTTFYAGKNVINCNSKGVKTLTVTQEVASMSVGVHVSVKLYRRKISRLSLPEVGFRGIAFKWRYQQIFNWFRYALETFWRPYHKKVQF